MFFRRKRHGLTPAQIAKVERWERDSLKNFFASQARVGSDEELWSGIERLVFAHSPREIVEVLQAHPVLLTDRAGAALSITEMFATMAQLPFVPAVLADRRAWIERQRDVDPGAES